MCQILFLLLRVSIIHNFSSDIQNLSHQNHIFIENNNIKNIIQIFRLKWFGLSEESFETAIFVRIFSFKAKEIVGRF